MPSAPAAVGAERRGRRPAVELAARRRRDERRAGRPRRARGRRGRAGPAARGSRRSRRGASTRIATPIRQVDAEDPVPVEGVDDDAAEQRPERDADARERTTRGRARAAAPRA